MTNYIVVDIETRSKVNLKLCGVYRYAEDVTILLVGLKQPGRSTVVYNREEGLHLLTKLAADPNNYFVAHNAEFERVCLAAEGVSIPFERWVCTASLSAMMGGPRHLAECGSWWKLDVRKDKRGIDLVNLFCVPREDGSFASPSDHLIEWDEFERYCAQDVDTEVALWDLLSPFLLGAGMPAAYALDQKINQQGALLDMSLVRTLHHSAGVVQGGARALFEAIYGFLPGSYAKVGQWLRDYGYDVPDTQAETLAPILDDPDCDPEVRAFLELRAEAQGAAAKKYTAMLNQVSPDNRLRGQFVYSGAEQTGRWSSTGVQLHNAPRAALNEQEIRDLKDRLNQGRQASPRELRNAIRPCFVAPSTGDWTLAWADFAQVEARVLADLAGDEAMLSAFESGDPYSAEAMRCLKMAKPPAKDSRERQLGKAVVLGMGYGGGPGHPDEFDGALSRSLKQYGLPPMPYLNRREIVTAYREGHPWTTGFWEECQNALISSAEGTTWAFHNKRLTLTKREPNWGNVYSTLILPSGRHLLYRDLRVIGETSWGAPEFGCTVPRSAGAGKGWLPKRLWGGMLTENIVQAVARDLLADFMLYMDGNGYTPVMHVHDEAVFEVRLENVPTFEATVEGWKRPSWINASGRLDYPIEIKYGQRYGK